MQVLSEAVPMTNGEVYALMRRRRDERNAARHPPFGLQPVLAEGHAALPQPPQRSGGPGSTVAGSSLASVLPSGPASALSGLTGSNAAPSVSTVQSRAVPADMLDSAAAAQAASTASLLSAPSSGHLVVLLTEVTVLNYLANHASLLYDTTAASAAPAAFRHTLRDVYGPTSVYDRGVAEALPLCGLAPAPGNGQQQPQNAVAPSCADALVDSENVSACYAALARCRPGTAGHVHAVTELLDAYDEAGRAQERVYAAGVRRVVQELRRRQLWTADGAAHASVAVKAEEDTETARGDQRASSTTNGTSSNGVADHAGGLASRRLQNEATSASEANARPSVPLLLEPTPLWGSGAVAATTTAAAPGRQDATQAQPPPSCRSLLTEAEVLQLVVGRPQSALDVYRLLDDVDSRLHYNEEAITAFVEGITAVFAPATASH